jgi:hypothetical protein
MNFAVAANKELACEVLLVLVGAVFLGNHMTSFQVFLPSMNSLGRAIGHIVPFMSTCFTKIDVSTRKGNSFFWYWGQPAFSKIPSFCTRSHHCKSEVPEFDTQPPVSGSTTFELGAWNTRLVTVPLTTYSGDSAHIALISDPWTRVNPQGSPSTQTLSPSFQSA